MTPRISVVMSVYNGAEHLCAALDGILAQTFRDFELIVVNDGSHDGTGDILRRYSGQDSRLRVIEQANAGLTRALMAGCAAARGEWIARHDADDVSHPERFARCLDLAEAHPGLVMIGTWARYVEAGGDVVDSIERPAAPDVATRALLFERAGPPAHGCVMFRRDAYEAAGGYRACFYFGQDSDLWLRLAEQGRLGYVPDYLYVARSAPGGISGASGRWQHEFGELGQLCAQARRRGAGEHEFLARADQLRLRIISCSAGSAPDRRSEAAANYRIGTCLARQGNRRARGYFLAAVKLNPLHWRGWCRLAAECLRPHRAAAATGEAPAPT